MLRSMQCSFCKNKFPQAMQETKYQRHIFNKLNECLQYFKKVSNIHFSTAEVKAINLETLRQIKSNK